ncbi:unnamed protein product [Wuchereria bancrofti]|uniref:Uncharacterized protein n=1 Tax=Wuchereria bancrofti TaxID=6293 RepID=A0A3P7GDY3_WUCBA|nr:unnamed protein product [Wuchereria bancrofti]
MEKVAGNIPEEFAEAMTYRNQSSVIRFGYSTDFFSCRISTLLQILNHISSFAKLVMAKRVRTKSIGQYNCVVAAFTVYSRPISKETSCNRIVPQVVHHQNSTSIMCVYQLILFVGLIYRTNPPCTFEQIIFSFRRRHIKLQLDCQSNIEIIQQAKFEYDKISVLEVIDEDSCRSVDYIQAVYSTVSSDSGNFNSFFCKYVYLSMGALTTIIFAATVSTLIAEFHFQRRHYLAKNKPVKLIINRELLNQVRLARRALHPIGMHFLIAIIEK